MENKHQIIGTKRSCGPLTWNRKQSVKHRPRNHKPRQIAKGVYLDMEPLPVDFQHSVVKIVKIGRGPQGNWTNKVEK